MVHNFVEGDILTPSIMNQIQADLDADTTAIAGNSVDIFNLQTTTAALTTGLSTANANILTNTANIATNTAAISNINYSDSTYISMMATNGAQLANPSFICKLHYQTHFGMVTILPARRQLQQEMYPCYSDTAGTASAFAVSCSNITIPYALGPYSTTKFGSGKIFYVGQWVAFTVDTPHDYATNQAGYNNNMRLMYGQVTSYNSVTPSITVNITYYRKRSTDGANMVVNGNAYLSSAFPFLCRQTSSTFSAREDQVEAMGMALFTLGGGSSAAWWTPEVEFYSWADPDNLTYTPFTTFLHNEGPLT